MIEEHDIAEATGLVARWYRARQKGWEHEAIFMIELRLLALGVKLKEPLGAPDPRAPPGGRTLALKVA